MFYVMLCHSDQSEESTIITRQQSFGLYYPPIQTKSKQHSLTPPLSIKLPRSLWSSHKSSVFKYGTLVFKYETSVFEYETLVFKYGTAVFEYGTLVFKYRTAVLEYETLVFKHGTLVFKYEASGLRYESFIFQYKAAKRLSKSKGLMSKSTATLDVDIDTFACNFY